MTLILTVANSRGVHQSSDFQLCHQKTGAPVSDAAGSKQLQASFRHLQINLAFTGVAASGPSRTIDWLGDEIKRLQSSQPEASLQTICAALAARAATELKPLGERGVLTVILAVAETAKPFRVAVISNVHWTEQPPRANYCFDVRVHTITKPFCLISGYRNAVQVQEQHRLAALARVRNRLAGEILDGLKAINAAVAPHSGGYVSTDCWVTSQVADGPGRRTAGINTAKPSGWIPLLQNGVDLNELLRNHFRPGTLGGLVQCATVFGVPGSPAPAPDGEPRCFALAGSSVSGALLSPTGQTCASIRIEQIASEVTIRRNETATVPFAAVRITDIRPSTCADFPKPLWPWPALAPAFTIAGVSVAGGCEYRLGYWIEHGEHHLTIPPSSMGIRNLSVLRDDEEFVLVAPSLQRVFTWSNADDGIVRTLEATFSWRMRPETGAEQPTPASRARTSQP